MAIEVPRRPLHRPPEPGPQDAAQAPPGAPRRVPAPRPPAPPPKQWVQDLTRGTPNAWVVPLLIAINAALFAYQVLVDGLSMSGGMSLFGPAMTEAEGAAYSQQLVAWGANVPARTLGDEPWRLVASMFLHIGALHLVMNMFVLAQVGPLVERLFGNLPFLVIYLLAGITGSLASAMIGQHPVSAGASGAVFGVFGALLGYLLIQWRTIPRQVLLSLRSSAVSFVILNVTIGVLLKFVDNSAHLGGLAGGFLFALPLARPVGDAGRRRRAVRAAIVALIGAAAVYGALTYAGPREVDPFEEIERGVRNVRAPGDRLDGSDGSR